MREREEIALPEGTLSPLLEEQFAAWLQREEFAAATIRKYRVWVRFLWPEPDLHRCSPHSRTMARAAWRSFKLFHPAAPLLIEAESSSERIREARSLEQDDWNKLRGALLPGARSNPADACLLALCLTGLRGCDLWRLTAADLSIDFNHQQLRVLQKGGRYRHIKLLPIQAVVFATIAKGVRDTGSRNIAEWLSGDPNTESSPPAWHALRNRFHEVAATIGLPGRIHLHRLRRTVAVHVLRRTHDLHLVKELLGQKSIRSTEQYADEGRQDEVQAALQGLIDE